MTETQFEALLAAAGRHRHRDSARPYAQSTDAVAKHNLPLQLTSFIGRKAELIEVERMLDSTRLLTLTGVGGVGKTRLALEVAARAVPKYPGGVRWVELASLADPSLVPQALADAVGVREESGRPPQLTLESHLISRRLLLVLDNCEHLSSACAQIADRLLRICPQVRILATSRQSFGLAGEVAWRVPPMNVPDHEESNTDSEFSQIDAVRLFIERAGAARPGFQLTDDNCTSVARVCSQLEGIPLALELAAARVTALGVRQIASRLHNRLRLLTGGGRSALPRQQTLLASLDWSYALLSAGEQTLFDRLAVFAGGFALETAEIICAGSSVNQTEVLDQLAQLVGKSLVIADEQLGEMRYRLLDTLREYAEDHLATTNELDEIRERHAGYFLQVAKESDSELRGPRQTEWLIRLDREYDNLRAALRWYVERAHVEQGLRLGASLTRYWYMRGHLTEGRQRLDELLSLADTRSVASHYMAARAAALSAAGYLAWRQGDFEMARTNLEESLAIFRELGDRWGAAAVVTNLGEVAESRGEFLAAESLFEESRAIFQELGDRWMVAVALTNLGEVALARGDLRTARSQLEQALPIFRKLGDRWGTAVVVNNLGEVSAAHSDLVAARAMFAHSLAIFRELGERQKVAALLDNMGEVAEREHDAARARSLFAESLTIFQALGDQRGTANALEGIARVAAIDGQARRALRLAGAASALREATDARLRPAEQERHQQALMRAELMLTEPERASVWAAGKLMTIEQAITCALGESTSTK